MKEISKIGRIGVLLTRAPADAAALRRALERLGYRVHQFGAIRTAPPRRLEPLRSAVAAIGAFTDVVIASRPAAEALTRAMKDAGQSPRSLRALRVIAVGPATARALRGWGFSKVLVPRSTTGRGVVDLLRRLGDATGRRVLLPAVEDGRVEIEHGLRALGARVERVEAYRTVLATRMPISLRRALDAQRIQAALFASPSAVRAFATCCGKRRCTRLAPGLWTIAIGPTTRDALLAAGFERVVQSTATATASLAAAVRRVLPGR